MGESIRRTILEKVSTFPTISVVASKVMRLLTSPNWDFHSVEEAVRVDPGLTANILKMANSAYFGHAGQLSSVRQAIATLGGNRMSQLVTISAAAGIMQKPVRGYELGQGELWRQAVAASVAAEHLIQDHRIRSADEAFTAALLRDVGKMIMGDFVESYSGQIEMAVLGGASFEDAEREVLGVDHAELGGFILHHWTLPGDIVDAVRYHHNPDMANPPNSLVDVVHAADVLALNIQKSARKEARIMPAASALERLGLTLEAMDAAETKIIVELGEVAAMFKDDAGGPESGKADS